MGQVLMASKLDDEEIQKMMCKALVDIVHGGYPYMGAFVQEFFDLGSCYFNSRNEEVIRTYLEIWTTIADRELIEL